MNHELPLNELRAKALYHAKRSGFYYAKGDLDRSKAHEKIAEGYLDLALKKATEG